MNAATMLEIAWGISSEAALRISNVMLLCGKCNHPVRIGYRTLEDGRKVRFCHACGEVVD